MVREKRLEEMLCTQPNILPLDLCLAHLWVEGAATSVI